MQEAEKSVIIQSPQNVITVDIFLDADIIESIENFDPMIGLPEVIKPEPVVTEEQRNIQKTTNMLVIAFTSGNKYVNRDDIISEIGLTSSIFSSFIQKVRKYIRTNTKYTLSRLYNSKGIFYYLIQYKEDSDSEPEWIKNV